MPYVYTHGAGTELSPYQIFTPADLNGVREHLDSHFVVMADINLSGFAAIEHTLPSLDANMAPQVWATGWTPIGNYQNPFTGVFNGNNKNIENLQFNRESVSFNGLFGCVLNANLFDFNLVNINIIGGRETNAHVGYARTSTVSNVAYSGNIIRR